MVMSLLMRKMSCLLCAPARQGLWALMVGSLVLLGVGCQTKELEAPPPAAPGVTYTGPAYLRNTVGSLARLRNNQPMPVSGFGFVAGLNGTGHRGAPAYLRQRIINEMKKGGFGSPKLGTTLLTPERALDDIDTAVVAVEGLIPPGATEGTRFDVLVSALPATETTSLAGGRLYTTDLALGGTNPANRYSRPLARARGPLYLNPFDAQEPDEESQAFRRQGIIVGGGQVTEDRQIEVVLNQPSWQRARAIEDRINERFPMTPDDRLTKTANAISNLVIRIHVPKRFAREPEKLLGLIARLYINNAPQFEPRQARRLYQQFKEDPSVGEDVKLAWMALGKTITPVLREYYEDERQDIRLAALEAGAYLQDERTSRDLLALAGSDDPQLRARVARALVNLPKSLRGGRALKQLLDDPEISVRIAAYESLARTGDPIVDRIAVRNEAGLKFIIDRVPAQRPLVYVTYRDVPRIVIFNPMLGFELPEVARVWDNRLMLRTPETLGEALSGLEVGGTLFLPVFGRGKLIETGSPRWQAPVIDAVGTSAALTITSKDLHDRFAEAVQQTTDKPQAVIVAKLMKREVDPDTLETSVELKLLDLRRPGSERPVMVYYQGPDSPRGKTYKIQPTVATLAFMLAHKPTMDLPQEGLDLSYSEVVDALYRLCEKGYVSAPIKVDTTPLAALIAKQDAGELTGPRPETGGEGGSGSDAEPRGLEPSDPAEAEPTQTRPEQGTGAESAQGPSRRGPRTETASR